MNGQRSHPHRSVLTQRHQNRELREREISCGNAARTAPAHHYEYVERIPGQLRGELPNTASQCVAWLDLYVEMAGSYPLYSLTS